MNLPLSFKLDLSREWSDWFAITPGDATALLTLNRENREFRPTVVKSYTEAMKRGEWTRTHQGIGISKTGRLIDGQHRLMAITQSGVTLDMLIVTGLDDVVFKDIDVHSKRSLSDAFHEPKNIMEAVNRAARIVLGNHTTPAQTEPYLRVLGPVLHSLVDSKVRKRIVTSAPVVLAAAITILETGDSDYVQTLFQTLKRSDFANMPPVALAFMKQVSDGTVNTSANGTDAMARAFVLFDASRRNTAKIIIKDASIATDRVRNVLRPLVQAQTSAAA